MLSISLELFVIAVVLRMLFMLQNHWTGKLKAIMVFALRLPSVKSSSKEHQHILISLYTGSSSSLYTDSSRFATSVPPPTLLSTASSS